MTRAEFQKSLEARKLAENKELATLNIFEASLEAW